MKTFTFAVLSTQCLVGLVSFPVPVQQRKMMLLLFLERQQQITWNKHRRTWVASVSTGSHVTEQSPKIGFHLQTIKLHQHKM